MKSNKEEEDKKQQKNLENFSERKQCTQCNNNKRRLTIVWRFYHYCNLFKSVRRIYLYINGKRCAINPREKEEGKNGKNGRKTFCPLGYCAVSARSGNGDVSLFFADIKSLRLENFKRNEIFESDGLFCRYQFYQLPVNN